jgi:UPF0755 protein
MNIRSNTPWSRPYRRHSRASRRLFMLAAALFLVVVIGSMLVNHSYASRLKPLSDSSQSRYITIASGASPNDIGQLLFDSQLIRSPDAFVWYVTTHNQRDKLQAGTYRLAPNMSTPTIATMIANGKVASDLVTVLSGQTLTEIRKVFITAGFTVNAVDTSLRADQYTGNAALADNPPNATLEGFLYPDSYQKTSATTPQQIIAQSLDEMQQHITPDIRNGFAAQGLTVYQGVTLASIVEQEVPSQPDRVQVAQVFLSRLRQRMKLGSNVTKNYAKTANDPSYDTFLVPALPAGPIGTISDGSLQAVAHPSNTDWLYFVTGDDHHTYFSHTYAEHQALVAKYCHKLCS